MAIYVTSDAHGHARALDRALDLAQPGAHDVVFVLGDMVDRGPDPLGVIRIVRSLHNVHVLMGNHEAMMLDVIGGGDELGELSWHLNGGFVTSQQLDALDKGACMEVLDWVSGLPTFAVVETDDARRSAPAGARRRHLLCHAGIDAPKLRIDLETAGVTPDALGGYGTATADDLLDAMAHQDIDELLWTRDAFWGAPTGLVGADGSGPVVVSGHTPSLLLGRHTRQVCGPLLDDDGRARMVEVGATADTGGVADRICIDCAAAAGHPSGCVGIMRLEDRRMWRAAIEEGA